MLNCSCCELLIVSRFPVATMRVGDEEAFSVQVKTKSTQASYWLLSGDYKRFVSDSHIYVFVSIKEGGVPAEFFIIPSKVVAKKA